MEERLAQETHQLSYPNVEFQKLTDWLMNNCYSKLKTPQE